MDDKDFSRKDMTKAICGTLLAIAAVAAVWVRAETMGPCDKFLGTVDMQCAAEAAAARMGGYPYSYSPDLLGQ